jgi:hypothetical protein
MVTRGGFLAIRDPVSRGPTSSGVWWPPWPNRGHAPAPVVLVDTRCHRNRISVVLLTGYALGGDPDKKAGVCHGGPSEDPRCIVLAKSPLKIESPFHLSRRSPLKSALHPQDPVRREGLWVPMDYPRVQEWHDSGDR